MHFKDQLVWITGASSGIGRGLALAMAKEGAQLIVSGRNEAALAEVVAACPGATALPFEASDLDALPDIVARAEAIGGRIDCLVNNAGISQRSLALDTDFDVYRTIMEVDFFAPLRLTQLVLPGMVRRRSGAIVNNASVAGKVGSPLRTGYSAAKHALVGYSDALRAEVAQYGVTVYVLTPGFVATGIAANALKGDGSINGPTDDPVNAGISIDEAAAIILAALAADTPEIPVARAGSPELALLDFPRSNPVALFDVMASMAPKVDRP